MDISSKLNPGYLYYYEFEGSRAIGEYYEDFVEDSEFLSGGYTEKYMIEVWSDDWILSHVYFGTDQNKVQIIKELGNAYPIKENIDIIVENLKEEFPEYFI